MNYDVIVAQEELEQDMVEALDWFFARNEEEDQCFDIVINAIEN